MNDRLNPNRRAILHAVTVGAGAAVTGVPPAAIAAAATPNNDEKGRARYQPDSPEVQTFYRVNSYPKK
jgi:hypothetical protein